MYNTSIVNRTKIYSIQEFLISYTDLCLDNVLSVLSQSPSTPHVIPDGTNAPSSLRCKDLTLASNRIVHSDPRSLPVIKKSKRSKAFLMCDLFKYLKIKKNVASKYG